ncbi:MAG: metal-sensing transcriptional repressor [Lachnospiraceae bacterium]|nr:metal-sensing transcriptional repressor [Lachnospiraceae bacterium]
MEQYMDSANLHRRLRKIAGQVNAIDRMVDEDLPCEDILLQVNAAKAALHKVGQIMLEKHLEQCIKGGMEHGDAERIIADFSKAVERFSNIK